MDIEHLVVIAKTPDGQVACVVHETTDIFATGKVRTFEDLGGKGYVCDSLLTFDGQLTTDILQMARWNTQVPLNEVVGRLQHRASSVAFRVKILGYAVVSKFLNPMAVTEIIALP